MMLLLWGQVLHFGHKRTCPFSCQLLLNNCGMSNCLLYFPFPSIEYLKYLVTFEIPSSMFGDGQQTQTLQVGAQASLQAISRLKIIIK